MREIEWEERQKMKVSNIVIKYNNIIISKNHKKHRNDKYNQNHTERCDGCVDLQVELSDEHFSHHPVRTSIQAYV